MNALAWCRNTDEHLPTLILGEVTLGLAEKVFNQGKFRITNHFEELTRDYFRLLNLAHNKLVDSSRLEPSIKRLSQRRAGKSVFIFRNQINKGVSDMRICQVVLK